ncbi:threonine synthase [Sutterella sp.]|uniref:threonine synthase n=1 Tax=Sutterella sp. TaxID=1981025 RepID=UPI0026DEF3B7|nr:threonine synthase [Sutterella sp.]MDO5531492.1 threonine synthase [Sutterella sp.]
MQYHSTRNPEEILSGREAVLQGLARDGGLFVTDSLDGCQIDPATLTGGYHDTARRVLSALLDDYSAEEINASVEAAYSAKNFSSPDVTPVTPIGDMHLLELYHGPTAAFKDVALCMLPQLMSRALEGTGRKLMIITATSGDTGKAALSGFQDVPGIGITVFYPEGGVSAVQHLQMATQEGANVAVCAVRGNFDDAQTAVKALFASPVTKDLGEIGVSLSSANSINIGRLVPQIVYYFDAYRQLLQAGKIKAGDEIDFTVPTGNFGDVLAGYCAKRMGLPVGRLVVASNANDVLTEFLETGVYNRKRTFYKTISPSMDILVSSNLERALYWIDGHDAARTRARLEALKSEGVYSVDADLLAKFKSIFGCGSVDDAGTKDAIREAWETTGRLIDPHTAVAWAVARRERRAGVEMVVLSTASPYKFCRDVYTAIYGELKTKAADEGAQAFEYMDALADNTGVEPPACLSGLRTKPVLWKDVENIPDLPQYVLAQARAKLA